MDDEFFDGLRGLFTDEEILDLTLCVAVFLGLGRTLSVLGIDQSCADRDLNPSALDSAEPPTR